MSVVRWFPTLTGLKVDQDRSLPYKLIDAIFQLYRKHYDLSDQVEVLSAAAKAAENSITSTVAIQATRAEMNLYPAAKYPLGSFYVISDWNDVTYLCRIVDDVHQWTYLHGELRKAQASLAGLGLGANDANLPVAVTDYAHKLRWNGSAFTWAEGDDQSDYLEMRRSAPSPITGWIIADGKGDDGSAIGVAHPINYLKSDGTLGQVTTLGDLTAGVYPKLGAAFDGLVNAAVAGSITGDTADESTHTHAAGTLAAANESAHTHSIEHDHPAATSGDVNAGGTNSFQMGTGGFNSVADDTHTHDVDLPNYVGDSGAGSAHGHTISGSTAAGAAHKHGAGTLAVDDSAEPKNMIWLPYYRK